MKFRFLCSPKEIVKGPDGRICKLIVTENNLVKKGEGTAAKATDQTTELDIDTMIFAIGDVHDPNLGLPMGPEGYSTKPVAGRRALALPGGRSADRRRDGRPLRGGLGAPRQRRPGRHRAPRRRGRRHPRPQLPPGQAGQGARAVVETIENDAARPRRPGGEQERSWRCSARPRRRKRRRANLTYFKYSDDTSMLRAITREKELDSTPAMAGAGD